MARSATPRKTLKIELDWIDENINGKPYGIDLLIPNKMDHKGENAMTTEDLKALIHATAIAYINQLLEAHEIDTTDLWSGKYGTDYTHNMREAGAGDLLDVAFEHPISLFVNALGVPPRIGHRALPRPRYRGRRADKRPRACAQTRRRRRRYFGGVGHRGRRPLRRNLDAWWWFPT